MTGTSASALFLILLLAPPAVSQQANSQRPLAVTPAQFSTLRWLEGTWRGRGEDGSRFYERYTFVDDSTIQMASFSDSTFRQSTEGDRVRLRDGVIRYENVVATALESDRVQFNVPGEADGFTWQRNGATGWVAILRWGGRAPVTYQMERFTPPDTASAARSEAAHQAVLDYLEGVDEFFAPAADVHRGERTTPSTTSEEITMFDAQDEHA